MAKHNFILLFWTGNNNVPVIVQNGDARKNIEPPVAAKVNPTATEHKPKSQNGSTGGEKESTNENKPNPPIPSQKGNNSTNNESKAKAISETESSQKNGKINIDPVLLHKNNITAKNEDNVKKSSSGPSKSEKMSSTSTGKRNIGSIIGAKGNSTRIREEVAGGLLSSEKTSNGRRHVGATIGGKHTSITGNGGNGRRQIGSVIGRKNNNQASNISIEIVTTKRNIGSTIGDTTNNNAIKTQSALLNSGKKNGGNGKRNIGSVIGSKVLPGGGQQFLVNLKVHNQPFSVRNPKPHQDSSLQEVPLFDILSFR